MYYPKIETLWKRDKKREFVIMPGEYSREEFKVIKKWIFTEKIDGMNIQIHYENKNHFYGSSLSFEGRTPKAELSAELIRFLGKKFNRVSVEDKFDNVKEITLFGEGYGAGIRKGGLYQEAKGFILFDAVVDGTWLLRESIVDIASHFEIKCVPELEFVKTIEEAVDYTQSCPQSRIAEGVKEMEGIVARSDPLMLFRSGNPLMWKLKTEDFKALVVQDEKEN